MIGIGLGQGPFTDTSGTTIRNRGAVDFHEQVLLRAQLEDGMGEENGISAEDCAVDGFSIVMWAKLNSAIAQPFALRFEDKFSLALEPGEDPVLIATNTDDETFTLAHSGGIEDSWMCVMVSLTKEGVGQFYIGDTATPEEAVTDFTGAGFDFAGLAISINEDGGSARVRNFMFFLERLDFSEESTRRKFYDPERSGSFVDAIRSDLPVAAIFLPYQPPDTHINIGRGKNFDENGSLAASPDDPSEGPSDFTLQAVDFSAGWIRATPLTGSGLTGSGISVVAFVKPNANSSQQVLTLDGGNNNFKIGPEQINFSAYNGVGSAEMWAFTTFPGTEIPLLAEDVWSVIFISIDNNGAHELWVGDTDVFDVENSGIADFDGTGDFSAGGNAAIGAEHGGNNKTGCVFGLWVAMAYVDWSDQAERRKFADDNGVPIDPRLAGGLPAPVIHMMRPVTSCQFNDGTADHFTKVSTPVACDTEPQITWPAPEEEP